MKAVVVRAPGGLDRIEMIDLPDPGEPAPGEICVRIHASSINYRDLTICSGMWPLAADRIPLVDAGGVVEAVGDGVKDFAVGDHVVSLYFPTWQDGSVRNADTATSPGFGADGYARTHCRAPASAFTSAPIGWSHVEAATVTTAGLTAWRALVVEGGLKPGDTVLALGTGGVSIYSLQIAKAMGARVIITSSSDAKLEMARALGADETVNYREVPEWGKRVRELTGGAGADHVIEVGGSATLVQSVTALAVGGHISLIGGLSGNAGELPIVELMVKQGKIHSIMVGSRRHQQDFVRAINQFAFRPIVDTSFPIDRLVDAFHYEKQAQHFGKIAITL